MFHLKFASQNRADRFFHLRYQDGSDFEKNSPQSFDAILQAEINQLLNFDGQNLSPFEKTFSI
jgi:hypothetical protein